MRRTSLSRLAFILLLGLSAPAALRAQGVFETPDKFHVSLTWQFTSIDTQAQLVHKGSNLEAGVGLNFEDTFDIPVQKQAWAFNGTWRMANRHMLDVGYLAINRTGDKNVNKTIEWGDLTISGNGKIRATFDTSFPYVGYRYGFYEGGDLEMSVGGGVSYLSIGMGLSATGMSVYNNYTGVTTTGGEKKGDFSFPVPLFAFQVDGRISKNWFMTGYYRSIYISTSDLKGGMSMTGLTASWYPSRHYGLGIGIERTVIPIERVTTGDYEARFKYNISGLTASAVFRF